MKRTIKFRAWNNKTKRFHSYIDKQGVSRLHEYSPYNGIVQPDSVIFDQFTGMTDKNGTELYENDIVSVFNFSGKISNINYFISYRQSWFELQSITGHKMPFSIFKEVVKIGNTYENSNLLGVNENVDKKDFVLLACNILGVNIHDVLGHSRKEKIVSAKAAVAKRMIKYYGAELKQKEICEYLNKHRATIIHYRDRINPSPQLTANIDALVRAGL